MKQIGVVLGRFAPLHLGHQKIINQLIYDFGIDNSLILIGSSTSYNNRTPYSLGDRITMIRTIYPDIHISDIADNNNKIEHFNIDKIDPWIARLKSMQNNLNKEFVFYAGSDSDIKYLKKDFKTHVVVDREKSPLNISATTVRNLLKNKNYKEISKYLDSLIIPLAVSGYKKFKKIHTHL